MSIKSDKWIIEMSRERGMIKPFIEEHVTAGLSFGAEGYGYDIRLGTKYKRLITRIGYTPTGPHQIAWHVDPRNIDPQCWEENEAIDNGPIWIPPHEFILAESVEIFDIPRSALMLVEGKSTYARCGLIINCTPFDPEWAGVATLCIVNPTRHFVAVHPGLGIGKALFFESDDVCALSYADKQGKYQNSLGVTLAKDGK